MAYNDDEIRVHTKIKVMIGSKLIETTVGRVIFNNLLPEGIDFVNDTMSKIETLKDRIQLLQAKRT